MPKDNVMKVVSVNATDAVDTSRFGPRLDLQPPPFARLMDGPDYNNCMVRIEVHASQRVKGKLSHFDTDSEVIGIIEASKSKPTEFEFSNIKFVRFEKPYQVTLEENGAQQAAQHIHLDNEARDFQVFFKDRSEITGKTYGSRVDKNGIHFYEQQKKGRKWRYCTHLFVAKSAVENYIIGEQIGGMLVRDNAISQKDLEDVLKEQKQERSMLLGDYLLGNKIVNGADLEKILARQKQMPNVKLGEILVSENLISEHQLQEALEAQKQKRRKSLGEILVDKGLIQHNQIQNSLANKLGIPYINLRKFNVPADAVKLVSADIAFNHKVMPLYQYDAKLVVAMEDPMDWQVIDILRFNVRQQIEPVMASREDINWAIQFYYSSEDLVASLPKLESSEKLDPGYDTGIFTPLEIAEVTSSSVMRLVNKIIEDAHRQKVSDIHIEPDVAENLVSVRFRKEGALSVYYKLPGKFRAALASRVKTMAGLDVTDKSRPQEGKIGYRKYGPLDIELKAISLPVADDVEDIVIKLLGSNRCLPVNALGLDNDSLDRVLELVSRKQGLFLVTGSAGAGKVTTLHSLLHYLDQPDRKICTIEDPITIKQAGIRQIEVNEKSGMTFTAGVKAMLQTDPDVMMIGALRDGEAAKTAVEAALSGHMVLSTLQTSSIVDSFQRLLDLGIGHLDLADSLVAVLSQKLVKTLCISCKRPYQPDLKELVFLAGEYCRDSQGLGSNEVPDKDSVNRVMKHWEQRFRVKDEFTFYKAPGCKDCLDSGYRGHIGVHQLLINSQDIRSLILNQAPPEEIRRVAMRATMRSHRQDGIEKILLGYTDYSRVRVL